MQGDSVWGVQAFVLRPWNIVCEFMLLLVHKLGGEGWSVVLILYCLDLCC